MMLLVFFFPYVIFSCRAILHFPLGGTLTPVSSSASSWGFDLAEVRFAMCLRSFLLLTLDDV